MDRNEELRQWFELSKQDLGIAKHLLNTYRPTPDETICFHCQQSAKKDLKGYLFSRNIELEKTHDLPKLLTMCIAENSEFTKFAKQVVFLSRYSVMPRYPNEIQINDDDAASSVRFADYIKKFILSKVILP